MDAGSAGQNLNKPFLLVQISPFHSLNYYSSCNSLPAQKLPTGTTAFCGARLARPFLWSLQRHPASCQLHAFTCPSAGACDSPTLQLGPAGLEDWALFQQVLLGDLGGRTAMKQPLQTEAPLALGRGRMHWRESSCNDARVA